MVDHHLSVASAVIVPERDCPQESSPSSAKRTGLPLESETGKRLRLDDAISEPVISSTTETGNRINRKLSGAVEERKRGKRLFGALLGTLSQSSSSAAEKRRLDIEKRQQAKLKSQSDQLDEKRKQYHAMLQEVRKQEQKKYEHQSLLIRHSNEMSMARFLVTQTKPQLYYKPWELSPEEIEKISLQVKEVESRVDEESSQRHNHHAPAEHTEGTREVGQTPAASHLPELTVGDITNVIVTADRTRPKSTDPSACDVPGAIKSPSSNHERDQADDAGEVVEGEEDTVIY